MCMDQWPFQNGNDEYDNDDDDVHGSFMIYMGLKTWCYDDKSEFKSFWVLP